MKWEVIMRAICRKQSKREIKELGKILTIGESRN